MLPCCMIMGCTNSPFWCARLADARRTIRCVSTRKNVSSRRHVPPLHLGEHGGSHVEKIPFNRASLVGQELEYIHQALVAGQLAGDGAFTKRCNALIVQKTGAAAALLTH